MKKHIILTLIMAMFFIACDKFASHDYKIKNASGAPIKVVFITKDNLSEQTLSIPVDQIASIYIDQLGNSRVSTYKQSDENLTSFSKIDIFKNDTIKAKTNFLKTSVWTYEEKNKHLAEYLLTVNASDF